MKGGNENAFTGREEGGRRGEGREEGGRDSIREGLGMTGGDENAFTVLRA